MQRHDGRRSLRVRVRVRVHREGQALPRNLTTGEQTGRKATVEGLRIERHRLKAQYSTVVRHCAAPEVAQPTVAVKPRIQRASERALGKMPRGPASPSLLIYSTVRCQEVYGAIARGSPEKETKPPARLRYHGCPCLL